MKLPEEYEEQNSVSPMLVTTMIASVFVVGLILIIVLVMNSQTKSNSGQNENQREPYGDSTQFTTYPDTSELITGSELTPDDFDFWDKYPEKSDDIPYEEVAGDEPEVVVNDPSTDGKHTLITYRDGKEEWVLISPYLPKHNYDFSKLVCQSNIMKYYENGKQVSFVGVDISKYQDYVDFVKLKKSGVDYVMIRVGARGYSTGTLVLDDFFSDNIKRATDAGLYIGLYFSSQAVTKEEAIEEAQMVLDNIGDYKISYPIAFDMEYAINDSARIDNLTKSEKTDIAKAFMDTISEAGYIPCIYGDKEWLIKEIDISKLTSYDVWLAQNSDIPDYPYQFSMWQYNTTTSIDGIEGYANLNISFVDYSEK